MQCGKAGNCQSLSDEGEACRYSSNCARNLLCEDIDDEWGQCKLRPGTASTGGATSRPPTMSSTSPGENEETEYEKEDSEEDPESSSEGGDTEEEGEVDWTKVRS